ncbi:hypothetical protein EJB05_39311, partial [Eragrostis curvula]
MRVRALRSSRGGGRSGARRGEVAGERASPGRRSERGVSPGRRLERRASPGRRPERRVAGEEAAAAASREVASETGKTTGLAATTGRTWAAPPSKPVESGAKMPPFLGSQRPERPAPGRFPRGRPAPGAGGEPGGEWCCQRRPKVVENKRQIDAYHLAAVDIPMNDGGRFRRQPVRFFCVFRRKKPVRLLVRAF